MIIATAGHIDHGKTLLVQALTGVDTDRLPEEKERGLTIDLGFAYQALPGGGMLGFVDVPGHERFIRNMLCGVAAVDFALLVIAADDGAMPQTTEHLAILDLLRIKHGAIVITKIDRVEAARAEEVADAARILVADTMLAEAPVFAVSAMTGTGIEPLRVHLHQAAEAWQSRAGGGNFRLAVDRAFTIAGAGMVVTGAVFSGSVATEDRLILSPGGQEVRVRGIRALDRPADSAHAGDRAALNIAGPDLRNQPPQRGNWLVAPAAHAPSRRLDVTLTILRAEARPFSHWTPVHVHLGAVDVTGRVALLEGRSLDPGATGRAQLVVDRPIGAMFGDRFIIRDQSARRTLGGGDVVDPLSPPRGRGSPERLADLAALDQQDVDGALEGLLARSARGVDVARFLCGRNMNDGERQALFDRVAVQWIDREHRMAVAPAYWTELAEEIEAALAAHHKNEPESVGPTDAQLRPRLAAGPRRDVFRGALDQLIRAGRVRRDGTSLRLPDHRPRLAEREAKLWVRIEPLLEDGGSRPPRLREIADILKMDYPPVEKVMQRAAAMGLVTPVAKNRYFPPAAVIALAEIAEQLAAEASDGVFDAAGYRDRTGIGRNLTIEVLEFFDRSGFTRRVGNNRQIRQPAADCFGSIG